MGKFPPKEVALSDFICTFARSIKVLLMNNMPTVTKNLLIINTLMYAATWVTETYYHIDLKDFLGLHFILAKDFGIYQFFTYMFMHGSLEHLFFNMFAVWMFGRIMEQTMGEKRFLWYYIICGLGAGLTQEIVQYIDFYIRGWNDFQQVNLDGNLIEMGSYLNNWTTVGASGAVYGILLSFGMTFPEERMFIFPLPVPIKAKYFVVGYAVIELLSALGQTHDGVAHFAHLGGMLFGLMLLLHWRNGGGQGNLWRKWKAKFQNMWGSGRDTQFRVRHGGKFEEEINYNRREREHEQEIDAILDKVKKGGYSSLTEEEKRKLFDASGRS